MEVEMLKIIYLDYIYLNYCKIKCYLILFIVLTKVNKDFSGFYKNKMVVYYICKKIFFTFVKLF